MNPAIPFLLLALTGPTIQAQSPALKGGGEVVLAGTRYRFEPESLMASTAAVEGKQVLQVRGRLVAEDPATALDIELITLGTRMIYRLNLVRHEGSAEKVRWGANLKTQVEVAAPGHPQDGDRATFKVQGPLVGMVEGTAKRATWSGSFWAGFSVEQVP
jgi:hypothetical protein